MNNIFIVKVIIIIVAIAANVFLALLVYKNNPKSATNRLYGVLSIVINLWLLANYASLLPALINISLWMIRLSIAFATLMSMFFYLFAYTLPKAHMVISKKRISLVALITCVTIAITLSPLAFTSVEIVNNSPKPVAGPGMGIFTLVSTTFSFLAVYVLFKKYKRSVGAEKQQFSYTLTAISTLLGLIIITVLVPVVAFNINSTVSLIPLYTVIFLGITTYAIVRHHLFNIRSAIARAIAYLMLLSTIGAIYGIAVFGLTNTLFNDERILLQVKVVYLFISILIAITLQPLKKFFDKVSNKLFYRDAYDPQVFLDQLNKNLVTNVEINKLLTQSSNIIVDNIKAEFCNFFIRDTSYAVHRNVGNTQKDISKDEVVLIDHFIKLHKNKVILTDSLTDLPDTAGLYKILHDNNIGVIARIFTHSEADVKGASYILMGNKKSGNPYNPEDLQTMDIITNELEIAIQNALRFEEIEKFNTTLQREVDDATRQLRMSNQKLKALDEAKDEFISMASHQLRTPLTSVKGYLSMLGEGDAGKLNETQMKFVDQAFVSSQRMVYLIADLLNVSRLKTGKFIIESQPVYLPDLIESEIAQLIETVKSRGLTMQFDKPKDFPTLMLDETKIRQVVMNFTDNAIYYTPAGGSVVLTLQQAGDSVEFAVQDDGMGVPKAEQPHLFTKFYRAGNARKARPDGTGLGLFMAKKVIVASGGSLIFDSVEGKGSTFGFRFSASKLKSTPVET